MTTATKHALVPRHPRMCDDWWSLDGTWHRCIRIADHDGVHRCSCGNDTDPLDFDQME